MQREQTLPRPTRHLADMGRRFPRGWWQVDELRADRSRRLPDWPNGCFLPLAGATAIVTGGRPPRPKDAPLIGAFGALAAWP